MEKASFWSLVPVLSIEIWHRIRSRHVEPSVVFMKRMGILPETVTPSLNTFFEVKGISATNQLLVWKDKSSFDRCNLFRLFDHTCENCNGSNIRFNNTEGSTTCQDCGAIISECMECPSFSSEHHGPSTAVPLGHTEKSRRVNTYMYKRCNHFKFWISRIQAKETTGVKRGVVEAVRRELQKERIEYGDTRNSQEQVTENDNMCVWTVRFSVAM